MFLEGSRSSREPLGVSLGGLGKVFGDLGGLPGGSGRSLGSFGAGLGGSGVDFSDAFAPEMGLKISLASVSQSKRSKI